MPTDREKTDLIDETWGKLKADYLFKKKDPFLAEGGLQLVSDFLESNVPAVRLVAAWNYYLDDTSKGDLYGYTLDRFKKQINMYLDKVRQGDGSRVKGKRTGKVQRSGYFYQCECGYELILDRQQCDGDFPDVLEEPCKRCEGRMRRVD